MIHRTRPEDVIIHESGWLPLPGTDLEVTAVAVQDSAHHIPGTSTPLFARLTPADAQAVAERFGARLIGPDEIQLLHDMAERGEACEVVAFTGTPIAETGIEHSERHDADVWRQLRERGWTGAVPVANDGKHWTMPLGCLMGWWVPRVEAYGSKTRRGPGFIQDRPTPGRLTHGLTHHDDGTTTKLVRARRGGPVRRLLVALSNAVMMVPRALDAALAPPLENIMRPTIRRGTTGEHVRAWQMVLGVRHDGTFGAGTEAATRAWQEKHGLVADGVVGAKSWIAAGHTPAPVVTLATGRDPRAPACVAALRDANAQWPGRRRASDGIMGDTAHQARPSDHNLGNAVDITHDVATGCDGNVISALAIDDARVSYVIWNARIYNRARADEGWRAYAGSNPHRHHIHISVLASARDDASAWPWAPGRM